MNPDILVWGAWGAAFLVLEGLALTRRVPWNTLSEFAWSIERKLPIFRVIFALGLIVLISHIVNINMTT